MNNLFRRFISNEIKMALIESLWRQNEKIKQKSAAESLKRNCRERLIRNRDVYRQSWCSVGVTGAWTIPHA